MFNYTLSEKTIPYILNHKDKVNNSKIALKYYNKEFSYRFINQHTNRIANGLLKLGLKKGDHVSILIQNKPEFLWTIFALGKIGVVAVPINTYAKGDLLHHFIDNSDSKWIIIDLELTPKLTPIINKLNKVKGMIYLSSEPTGEKDSLPMLNKLFEKLVDFTDLENNNSEFSAPEIKHSDPFLLMYTSGTTGPSKGVISPHSQGISVGCQVAEAYGYDENDIIYTCLPLFHGNALWYSAFPAFISNATLALSKRFSATKFWDEIQETQATQFNALGAMANIILKTSGNKAYQNNKVRQCMVVPSLGGEIAEEFERKFNLQLTSLYAMTETFAVSILGPNSPKNKQGSSGKPLDYVDVRIVDEQKQILPNGEVGEIVIRPNEPGIMMSGYYKLPEETLESISDLWFHTGDRGYLDKDNYLYFVDRKKDAIRRRGENISAYELETTILKHDSIYEVAAIPIPSELSEDEVMIFVVLKDNTEVTFEELIKYCDNNMPYFMVPRYIHFINQIPKTPSEKVEKYKLMEWAMENLDHVWDREKSDVKLKR